MGRGPYEPSLKRFVECLDNLDKDKAYTFEELEGICKQWHNTIRDYVSFRLAEVNVKLGERGKKVKPTDVIKKVCQSRTYPGLLVDPPLPDRSIDGWLVCLAILELTALLSTSKRQKSVYCPRCRRYVSIGLGSTVVHPICGAVYFACSCGKIWDITSNPPSFECTCGTVYELDAVPD